jgi:COMPASS component SPP1
MKSLRTRIARWEESGGARDLLWENVKNAAKREGVVVCAVTNGAGPGEVDVDSSNSEPKPLDSAAKRRAEREVARLNTRLGEVVKERELMKRELDMVMWREKVVELASERAGKVDECGWDQRLCFGEEEWADFGPEVLESYEEERVKVESGDDAMPLDAASGEWWCTGKKKCERHAT